METALFIVPHAIRKWDQAQSARGRAAIMDAKIHASGGVSMTLREIDAALAAWNDRLGAAARNLMDLQSEPAYQHLSGTGGLTKAKLEGVTAARVEPALGAMLTAFQHFALLNETIERAAHLRRNLPTLFGADQKLRDIEELLFGKSIRLPANDVPLEQRTLLSGVENIPYISPQDLLDVMVHTFQAAKDAVVAVDAAWASLAPAFDRIASRIARLRARVGEGSAWGADLDAAGRALAEARAKLQTDPLGASSGLEARVTPMLDRVESALDAQDRFRKQIGAQLASAQRLLGALINLHREALMACAEARQKISGCETLPEPAPNGKIEELRGWLDRLESKHSEGLLEPLASGLRNWNSAAEICVSDERAVYAAYRAPLDQRNELRGRLDALKAKARAYGVAERNGLAELALEAEALLYTRPTRLDRAAAAVSAYARALNGAT